MFNPFKFLTRKRNHVKLFRLISKYTFNMELCLVKAEAQWNTKEGKQYLALVEQNLTDAKRVIEELKNG